MASSRYSLTNADVQPVKAAPLHLAAIKGDVRKVKQRLALGDDVDGLCHLDDPVKGTVCSMTPLCCGAAHAKIVKTLLDAGANPSSINPGDGTSVLYVAALGGNVEAITLLIRAGAVVDWSDHEKRTPLFGAAFAGNDKAVKALLSAGAKIDTANFEGCTVLMTAARHGHEESVRVLLEAGADLRMAGNKGSNALHCGVMGGSVPVVQTLLKWGADVNSTSSDGMAALHIAAQRGDVDMIAALLRAGAAIDLFDQGGKTALSHGAYFGHEHVVEVLLSACAALKATDLKGAAANGNDNVVRTLLRWGMDVDTADSLGQTALFAAASQGHSSTVKLLLDAGSDPHVRDEDNATPLMHAKDLPTVRVLLEAGVSVTTIDSRGLTALHYAAMKGSNTAMMCAMFKAGANPTSRSEAGVTAAQVARATGHTDAATLLDMLAAKYMHTSNNEAEAKDKASTVEASEEVKAAALDSTNDEVVVGLAECSQAGEKEQQHKVLRPCLSCQTLTHRRCARCRTAYICSRDCQIATLAKHRVECLEISEKRERDEGERKAGEKQEESG